MTTLQEVVKELLIHEDFLIDKWNGVYIENKKYVVKAVYIGEEKQP